MNARSHPAAAKASRAASVLPAGDEGEAQGVLRLAAPRAGVVRGQAGDRGAEALLGLLEAARDGGRGARAPCSCARRRGRGAAPRGSRPRDRSAGLWNCSRRWPARYSSSTVFTFAGGGGGAYRGGSAVFGRGAVLVGDELRSRPRRGRRGAGPPRARRPGSATSRANGASGAIVAVVSKTTRSPAVRRTRASRRGVGRVGGDAGPAVLHLEVERALEVGGLDPAQLAHRVPVVDDACATRPAGSRSSRAGCRSSRRS